MTLFSFFHLISANLQIHLIIDHIESKDTDGLPFWYFLFNCLSVCKNLSANPPYHWSYWEQVYRWHCQSVGPRHGCNDSPCSCQLSKRIIMIWQNLKPIESNWNWEPTFLHRPMNLPTSGENFTHRIECTVQIPNFWGQPEKKVVAMLVLYENKQVHPGASASWSSWWWQWQKLVK